MDETRIVCPCLGITYADIKRAVEAGAKSFEEVQQRTRCGKSCSMCVERIRYETAILLNAQGALENGGTNGRGNAECMK